MYLSEEHITKISDIVAQYGVKSARLFGSYASGSADEKSDVDVLVELEHPNLFKVASIKVDVEEALGISADIFPTAADMSTKVRRNMIEKSIVIYEQ